LCEKVLFYNARVLPKHNELALQLIMSYTAPSTSVHIQYVEK
jgi:hypothetical protein